MKSQVPKEKEIENVLLVANILNRLFFRNGWLPMIAQTLVNLSAGSRARYWQVQWPFYPFWLSFGAPVPKDYPSQRLLSYGDGRTGTFEWISSNHIKQKTKT
jgi:SulP family sulfate permease